jgi:hypothetical protein
MAMNFPHELRSKGISPMTNSASVMPSDQMSLRGSKTPAQKLTPRARWSHSRPPPVLSLDGSDSAADGRADFRCGRSEPTSDRCCGCRGRKGGVSKRCCSRADRRPDKRSAVEAARGDGQLTNHFGRPSTPARRRRRRPFRPRRRSGRSRGRRPESRRRCTRCNGRPGRTLRRSHTACRGQLAPTFRTARTPSSPPMSTRWGSFPDTHRVGRPRATRPRRRSFQNPRPRRAARCIRRR